MLVRHLWYRVIAYQFLHYWVSLYILIVGCLYSYRVWWLDRVYANRWPRWSSYFVPSPVLLYLCTVNIVTPPPRSNSSSLFDVETRTLLSINLLSLRFSIDSIFTLPTFPFKFLTFLLPLKITMSVLSAQFEAFLSHECLHVQNFGAYFCSTWVHTNCFPGSIFDPRLNNGCT